MSNSIELYPTSTYKKNYNEYTVGFEKMSVPSWAATAIKIEKVTLFQNDVYVLAKIENPEDDDIIIDDPEFSKPVKIKVNLPNVIESNKIKVHRFVIGKNWKWNDPSYKGISFISDVKKYNEKIGIK